MARFINIFLFWLAMRYDMDAERAVFRERLTKRSDRGIELYLYRIFHGKGDGCEMGKMKYEEALAEALVRELDVSDYVPKRKFHTEASFRKKIDDVDSKTLERYFSRINPRTGLQKICYSLSPVWKMKKRVVREVLSERYAQNL